MPITLLRKSTPHYRADIDGLRGIAVLLVFAYHLGTARCRGGFVGVDVFFVISGYLIGSIILSEIANSKFSLASFYERRVRRIFPALFVVLCASCWFAYRYLASRGIRKLRQILARRHSLRIQHLLSSPVRIFRWPRRDEAPSPHLVPRRRRAILYFPSALSPRHPSLFAAHKTLAGLVSSECLFRRQLIGVFHNREAAFYLAHTRAWELLLGTLIAMDLLPRISALWRNIAAFSGLALIFSAGYFFSAATPFPGVAALLPCIGAALIIAAGRSGPSLAGQCLSFTPLVFVGMISYSLYLWHWPMIVFQGMGGLLIQGVSPKTAKLVVMAASFVIATLSWRFIEQPFRGRRFSISRPAIFSLAAASAAILLALGSSILFTNGLPSRFPSEAVKVASFLETSDSATEGQYRVGTCFLIGKDSYNQFDPSVCLHPTRKKRIIF